MTSEPMLGWGGMSRRDWLGRAGCGFGLLGLASLLRDEGRLGSARGADGLGARAVNPLAPQPAHFEAKAKRVIWIFVNGGPSHVDTWDYKPELEKWDGKTIREFAPEFSNTTGFFKDSVGNLMKSPFEFSARGECGKMVSSIFPHLGEHVDKMAFIHSGYTESNNHSPALFAMNTGFARMGFPCVGSWVTYGLGSESENLPGFVVLISSGVQPNGGKNSFGAGFLPSVYQGVQCRSQGDPVLFASDPPGMDRGLRRQTLDALRDLNAMQAERWGHPETLTRIAQYELAFRMQTSVPEVMDINRESAQTIADYGAMPGQASFANNCLLARRLVEQGVRFVQLFDWGWDFHGTGPGEDIRDGLTKKCATMDKPIAALIKDLKRLGMLDETLIICGGEFGRTPFREGRTAKGDILGRDHYPDCYSMWMAGGGIKGGYMHGESDELGFSIARDKVHVHDLQATILHTLGLDHTRLTRRFQGRDYRLTDVHGTVVRDILS